MNFQIHKRHILILAIAAAQAVCLCWGVFVFNSWLRTSVRQIVHDQVLADNVQSAKQLVALIRQMEISDLRKSQKSWLKLQDTVREIRLPNEGFVCVTDSNNGEVLCHPALKTAPKSLLDNLTSQSQVSPENLPTQYPTNTPTMLNKMSQPKTSSMEDVTVTGFTFGSGDHLEIIAAGYIPELDANVNVHQRASGVERKIASIMRPVIPIGLIVSLTLVVGTTLLVLEILRRYENRLARINENLEHLVDQRTLALKETRDAVIFGLAKLAESRDTDTGEHLERIRIYVTILAEHLRQQFDWIDNRYIENLGLASSLHDIGKVAIPDQILLKPGRFEPAEREIMETHAERGGECIQAISDRLGENDFLQLSREIAFAHHEKWDGSGYPFQAAGESIPFAARIVALADVYDALRSRRPYKDPMPHEKAKRILLEGDGSHFDPVIVEAFLACEDEFEAVSDEYAAAHDNVEDDSPVLTEV